MRPPHPFRPGYLILFLFLACMPLTAKKFIRISGDFLLYSYDHNYIYGRGNIVFNGPSIKITAIQIDVQIDARVARFSGDCKIYWNKRVYQADKVLFHLENYGLNYYTYQASIIQKSLVIDKKKSPAKSISIKPITYRKLEKSLLHFICHGVDIKSNFDVVGRKVTIFVEGVQSLSFRSFRMNRGLNQGDTLFYVNKLWYYNSTGLVADVFFNLQKGKEKTTFKTTNNLKLHYDIFNNRNFGPKWQFFLNSSNTLQFNKKNGFNLTLNHITENMSGASLSHNAQLGNWFNSTLTLDYNKPEHYREEFWMRSRFALNMKKGGNLRLNLNYEKQQQFRGELYYSNNSLKNVSFFASTSYSDLIGKDDTADRRLNSRVSLQYSTKLFNLSTEYSLNQDLIRDRSQANPRMRLQLSPFSLYGGLLKCSIYSTLDISHLRQTDIKESSYRSNTAIDLGSDPLAVTGSTDVNISLRLEQFIDKDPDNNYTSAGLVFKGTQKLWNSASFELMYNYQTRRRTEWWFIRGSTSQDFTALLKVGEPKGNFDAWTSLSYNGKWGKFTTGYLNCNIALTKMWKLQSLINYDFALQKLSYNFYLVRKAGRIIIRLAYRSLSKDFLIEILPG